jgi:hypothetical protein
METLKAIEARKSTRGFKPDQIPDAALETILKAGAQAPVSSVALGYVTEEAAATPKVARDIPFNTKNA